MRITIRGSSDDHILIQGDLSEQMDTHTAFNDESKQTYLAISDGTLVHVTYDGEWHLNPIRKGFCDIYRKLVSETNDYSERLILEGGIDWVIMAKEVGKYDLLTK